MNITGAGMTRYTVSGWGVSLYARTWEELLADIRLLRQNDVPAAAIRLSISGQHDLLAGVVCTNGGNVHRNRNGDPVTTQSTSIQMLHQCPGCWSFSTAVHTSGGYECDCGERRTLIDLRARTSDGPHGNHWTEDER